MPNPNIANEGVKFKKGQSGNPNGRPPLLVTTINRELKEKGFPPLKQSQLVDAYLQILNLDTDTVKQLHNKVKKGENMNFLYSLLLKNLHSNRSKEQIDSMLDRAIGKAVQKEEIKIEGQINTKEIDKRPVEELKDVIQQLVNK